MAGIASAARGVSKSIQQMLVERKLVDQQAIENEQRNQQLSTQAESEATQRQSVLAQMADRQRQRQIEEAGIRVGSMQPNQEVGGADLSALQGTPYEARLQSHATLPSSTIAMPGQADMQDPGGQAFRTLRPDAEQQQQIDLTSLRRRVEEDPTTAPSMKRIVSLKRIGVNASPEDVETPQERATRLAGEDTRELRMADEKAKIGARYRETSGGDYTTLTGPTGETQMVTKGPAANALLAKGWKIQSDIGHTTPKLAASQQEDLATMDTVAGLGNQVLALGTQIGWKGVGGFKAGTIQQFGAKNMGTGTQDEQKLRNAIGNIKGTIAKLRGGSALTPQELQLIETYTPTIDDDPKMIQAKIASLQDFIGEKKRNLIRVASGQFEDTAPAPTTPGAAKPTAEDLLKKYGGPSAR